MEEILPGLIHWRAFHEGIGRLVHSGLVCDSGTLLEPMQPAGGLDAVAAIGEPQRIVLSNRHRRNLTRVLEEEFDTLLFAHADPVLADGRSMLRAFLARAEASSP
jgi:hypothetical protein